MFIGCIQGDILIVVALVLQDLDDAVGHEVVDVAIHLNIGGEQP